jgi:hypothetical protein
MVTPRVILAIIAAALFSVSESTGDIVAAGGFVFMEELEVTSSSDFLSGVEDDMVKGKGKAFVKMIMNPMILRQCEHVKRQASSIQKQMTALVFEDHTPEFWYKRYVDYVCKIGVFKKASLSAPWRPLLVESRYAGAIPLSYREYSK